MSESKFILTKNPFEQVVEVDGEFTKFKVTASEVWCGDNYHDMGELYEHRYALFIALCKIYDNYITPLNTRVKCWKSKLHDDGTMFDDSFILGMSVIQFQGPVEIITYHIPLRLWDKINVIELPKAPPYDGHTSSNVIERLYKL